MVGIGINANWRSIDMPPEIEERATSLLELTGAPIDRVELLGSVLDRLAAEVVALERGESPVTRLRACSWLNGRRVEVDTGTERISGLAAGIADDGSLLLDAELGRLALSVGEVARVHELTTAGVGE